MNILIQRQKLDHQFSITYDRDFGIWCTG